MEPISKNPKLINICLPRKLLAQLVNLIFIITNNKVFRNAKSKKINVIHHLKKIEKIKSHNHFNSCRKRPVIKLYFNFDTKSQHIKRRDSLLPDKGVQKIGCCHEEE